MASYDLPARTDSDKHQRTGEARVYFVIVADDGEQ
jgi:hypothetical protein